MGPARSIFFEITVLNDSVRESMKAAATILALSAALACPVEAATIVRPLPGEPVVGTMIVEASAPASAARVDILIDDRLVGSMTSPPWITEIDAGFGAGERTLRLVVWSEGMAAREIVEHRAAALRMDAVVDVDIVEVPLRLHGHGPFEAEDLRITENGRLQRVLELHPTRPDSRFVFVVDRSLSMQGGRLERTLEGIRTMAESLRPGDRAEVILFNHTVMPPLGVSSDSLTVAAPSGGTALFDALASITAADRSIVIVVSDADDRHSSTRAETLRTLLADRSVTFYSVALSRGNASALLEELSRTTGGLAVRNRDPVAGLRSIADDISGRLVAVYQSDSAGAGWRSIEVEPARRSLRVADARRGYLAR